MGGLSDSLNGMFGGVLSRFSGFNPLWIGIFIICAVVVYLVVVALINKKRFVYKVRIFQTRENGSRKELNYKGGYIVNKGNGTNKFRIKKGKLPWDFIDLTTTPNPKAIDFENRIYYKQIDLKTYIQVKVVFDKSILIYKPIEQDIQYGAMLEMKRIDQALAKENKWAQVGPMVVMGIIFVTCIIGWYFLMDAKCPTTGK